VPIFKKQNKKLDQRGSALVLTVIVLVNALIIVAAISAISVIERKASSRTKNSAPAFQAADTAVEWVLYAIASDDDPANHTLEDVFDDGGYSISFDSSTNRYNCPSFLGVNCQFYFIDSAGAVIDDNTTDLTDIDAVRGVGKFGADEELASRAIEVKLELGGGPIAWWAFTEDDRDNGGGDSSAQDDEVEDLTPNANNATAYGGTWYVNDSECFDSANDTCIEFNGIISDPFVSGDNFAQAPDLPPIYQIADGTVALWFKTNDDTIDAQALFSKEATEEVDNHLTITLANSSSYFTIVHGVPPPTNGPEYIAVRMQEGTGDPLITGNSHIIYSDAPISADTWYFVALTFGSNGMMLYVAEDGGSVALQTDQDPYAGGFDGPHANFEDIQLGVDGIVKQIGMINPLERPLDGFMDDVRIYDYEMDLVELQKLFDDGPE